MHGKSIVFPKGGTSKLSIKLDMEQGLTKPAIDESLLLSWQQQGDDTDGMMPVSFTSRHGKLYDNMDQIKEKKYLEDKQCWCSICNSNLHTYKVSTVDICITFVCIMYDLICVY